MGIRYLLLNKDNAGDETLTIMSEKQLEKIKDTEKGLLTICCDVVEIIDLQEGIAYYESYEGELKTRKLPSSDNTLKYYL